MTSRFSADWWPTPPRRPWLRLAVALLGAMTATAAIATGLAYLIFGFNEIDGQTVAIKTRHAAFTAIGGALAYGATGGVAGLAALWALRLRSILWFLATGVLTGAAFYWVTTLIWTQLFRLDVMGVLAVWGAVMFALTRWFSGVRRSAPQA